jgi:hypothetical protein
VSAIDGPRHRPMLSELDPVLGCALHAAARVSRGHQKCFQKWFASRARDPGLELLPPLPCFDPLRAALPGDRTGIEVFRPGLSGLWRQRNSMSFNPRRAKLNSSAANIRFLSPDPSFNDATLRNVQPTPSDPTALTQRVRPWRAMLVLAHGTYGTDDGEAWHAPGPAAQRRLRPIARRAHRPSARAARSARQGTREAPLERHSPVRDVPSQHVKARDLPKGLDEPTGLPAVSAQHASQDA